MNSYIYFDNRSGVFTPGSVVTGTAVLTLSEPTSAREVTISVDGKACTHWSVSTTHSRTNSDGTTSSYTTTTNYDATVIIVNGESRTWGDGTKQKLPQGEHKFPFSFQLPSFCHPSFEGNYGNIRYHCKLTVDRPWKFNHTSKLPFTVATVTDLNLSPVLFSPVMASVSEKTGLPLFRKGNVLVKASLPKGGFVPGETIETVLEIENMSSKDVEQIDVRLIEVADFVGFSSHPKFPVNSGLVEARCMDERRHSERDCGKKKMTVSISKHSSGTVKVPLQIPPVVNSFSDCSIIRVGYVLKITVSTKAAFNSSVGLKVPVVIGTIPIRTYSTPQPFPSGPSPVYPTLPSASSDPVYPTGPAHLPSAPPLEQNTPNAPPYDEASMGPPPSYEESVFGSTAPTKEEEAFAPRYAFYGHLSTDSEEKTNTKT